MLVTVGVQLPATIMLASISAVTIATICTTSPVLLRASAVSGSTSMVAHMCSGGGGGGNPVLAGDSLDRSRMGGCEQQKSSISSIRRNAASRERGKGMRHREVAIKDDLPTGAAWAAAV
jgi:hypothetical protein